MPSRRRKPSVSGVPYGIPIRRSVPSSNRSRRRGAGREPEVDVVEEVFDDRPQLDGDLGMVLACDFSPADLVGDGLERPGEGHSLQSGDMWWGAVGWLGDDGGHGVGQSVGHLQAKTAYLGADRREVAESAAGLVWRRSADSVHAGQGCAS